MKTLLLFVILITTLIGDDVYPNDFHIYSDFTNVIHINETNKVSFTKMEEIVNHRIKSVDLDFKVTKLERSRSRLITLMQEVDDINRKSSEIGKNEVIFRSNDFQSLSTLLEQLNFIKSSVNYISDLSDVYHIALKNNSNDEVKNTVSIFIKNKASSLFHDLLFYKMTLKGRGVNYKELKSDVIIPYFIETTEKYSKLMDETKSLYDLIPVEKEILKKN
jgi:hypothetical protein